MLEISSAILNLNKLVKTWMGFFATKMAHIFLVVVVIVVVKIIENEVSNGMKPPEKMSQNV